MSHSSTAVLRPQRVGPGVKDLWLGLISVVAVFFIAKYAIRTITCPITRCRWD